MAPTATPGTEFLGARGDAEGDSRVQMPTGLVGDQDAGEDRESPPQLT